MKLFVSPHNDDAVLFGAFTLQQERPVVLTVFDSHVQVSRGFTQCDMRTRRGEDQAALAILGCQVGFSGIPDDTIDPIERIRAVLGHFIPSEVWLPVVEQDGHEQHNLVGQAGTEVFTSAKIHRYLTYTRRAGKSINGRQVMPTGKMVLEKLRALACYRTQIEIDALGCWPHFMDLREFMA